MAFGLKFMKLKQKQIKELLPTFIKEGICLIGTGAGITSMLERWWIRWEELWAKFIPGKEYVYATKRSIRRRLSGKIDYNADERRVALYLSRLTNYQIGAGGDPVGSLIALHASLHASSLMQGNQPHHH